MTEGVPPCRGLPEVELETSHRRTQSGHQTLSTQPSVGTGFSTSLCSSHPSRESRIRLRRGSSIINDKIRDALLVAEASESARTRTTFDYVICGVIVLNAIVIVLEVDFGPHDPYVPVHDRLLWFGAESLFTTFYLFELLFRIHQQRWLWTRSPSNWLDATIVGAAIVDCWLTLWLEADTTALRFLCLLRLLRAARLVRLVRLLRMRRGLFIATMAFCSAMKSLAWLVVLMVVGLLLSATFATVAIGHDDRFNHVRMRGHSACELFGTVPRSMYTLFELLTLTDWQEVGHPLVDERPVMFVFLFAFFMVFTVCLLHMIVGVALERTVAFAREHDSGAWQETKRRYTADLYRMRGVFEAAEEGGEIKLEALKAALERNSAVRDIFRDLSIPTHDVVELFTTLDLQREGRITVANFLEGVAKLRGTMPKKWDEMATHAGVRVLVRRVLRQMRREGGWPSQGSGKRGDSSKRGLPEGHGEPSPSRLAVQPPAPSPGGAPPEEPQRSTLPLRCRPQEEETERSVSLPPCTPHEEDASGRSAGREQLDVAAPVLACSAEERPAPTRSARKGGSKTINKGALLRVLQLWEQRAREQEERDREVFHRLDCLEQVVCGLRPPPLVACGPAA